MNFSQIYLPLWIQIYIKICKMIQIYIFIWQQGSIFEQHILKEKSKQLMQRSILHFQLSERIRFSPFLSKNKIQLLRKNNLLSFLQLYLILLIFSLCWTQTQQGLFNMKIQQL
ncbi:unnamed protein product [Paramecium sonneborni]|uniref:Transmembrane protein n=1 Tax=Paramecium sonneborni TaxID=65129 RepID=A0A8S1RRZ8_9CILI|nr:unnamed protein product [Paramecium sonneborni]